MIYQSVEDRRVYISDQYEHELEVDLAIMDEGIYVGVYMSGPDAGVEVDLSAQQVKEARELGQEQSIW